MVGLPLALTFADLGAPNLQQETISQQRSLANTGLHSDITYTHGVNNIKAGITYAQTFLNENFHLGIVDPNLVSNIDCFPNTTCGTLRPYDLTKGRITYRFK